MTIGDTFDRIWRHQWALLERMYYQEDEMPLTKVTLENVEEVFTYVPWNAPQVRKGQAVRDSLVAAVKVILENVPECPARTRAINMLVDARMLANSAISLEHLS